MEAGCDFWLEFHPTGSRALRIQNNGAEPAFDVVVQIPADGSGFKSDLINRVDNDRDWIYCGLNGNFVWLESIRKVLAQAVFDASGSGDEVKEIPVLISYRTREQHNCEFHLEIRMPLRNGIPFALPQTPAERAKTEKEQLEGKLAKAQLEELEAARKRRGAQEQTEARIKIRLAQFLKEGQDIQQKWEYGNLNAPHEKKDWESRVEAYLKEELVVLPSKTRHLF